MGRLLILTVVITFTLTACNLDDESRIVGGSDTGADVEDSTGADDSGDADESCSGEGLEECGGECINTNSNVEHCGACGNDCADDPRNTQCVEPSCAEATCSFDAHADGEACTLGDGPGVCTGGDCVECVADTECVAPPTDNTQCWEGSCESDNTCTYAVPDPTVVCGNPTCSGGQLTQPNQCGSQGECSTDGATQSCGAYLCNDAGDACLTQCTDDSDCQEVACVNGQCSASFGFDLTLSSDQRNVDLADELAVDGWDRTTPIDGTLTIANGVDVGSDDPAVAAFVIDALPDGSTVRLVVEGRILGAGGDGGNVYGHGSEPPYFRGFDAGGDGGHALSIVDQPSGVTIEVDNQGMIGGGGGGGAPGYSKDDNDDIGTGGGGGAGYVPGRGGTAEATLDEPNDGSGGTRLSGGAASGWDGYDAGAGGDLGQDGLPATSSESEGTAGVAGAAVTGASAITWTTQGDIRGAIMQ